MNLQSTYYFYSLADLPDNNTDPIDVTIRGVWWKATDYTIIMSKGKFPEGYSYEDATGQINLTTFTLTIDGENCATDGVKTIRQLDGSWHVVQSFSTGHLENGADYLLEGTTDSTLGNPSFIRTNVVRLKVR